jgi:hypothetical protein
MYSAHSLCATASCVLGIKGLEWVVVFELVLVFVLGFLGLGLGLAYMQGNRVSVWALHARLVDLVHQRVDFFLSRAVVNVGSVVLRPLLRAVLCRPAEVAKGVDSLLLRVVSAAKVFERFKE